MTSLVNSFEGGTPSSIITVANSGGTSGDPFTSVTANAFTFSSDAFHGSVSGKLDDAGASQVSSLQWDITATGALAARAYVKFPSVPAATVEPTFLWFGTAGVRRVALSYLSTGFLRFRSATSSSTVLYTSTFAPTPGTWYRVEVWAKPGASASTGELHFAIYAGDSLTKLDQFDSTTTDTGTTNFDVVRFGKAVTGTYTGALFDALALDTAATGFIGPYTEPAVVSGMVVLVYDGADWV